MGLSARLQIEPDNEAWTVAAARLVVDAAADAIARRGRFVIALAGGSTPRVVYERLAQSAWREQIDWSRVVVLFGDERSVPPSDEASNFHMASRALLDHVTLDPGNVHRMRGEDEPSAAADDYGETLRRVLGQETGAHEHSAGPVDLVLLGLGDNCHTASLFPGLTWSVLDEPWVLAEYVEVQQQWRLTMTPRLLAAARSVVFLVLGASKADAVASVLDGTRDPVVKPAQAVVERAETTWLLDAAAAALVAKRS